MFSDWLDVFEGVAVGFVAMATVLGIGLGAPTVLYWFFEGLYQFWSWVGVM